MTDEEHVDWVLSFERELSKQLEDCQGLPDLCDGLDDTAAELLGARHE